MHRIKQKKTISAKYHFTNARFEISSEQYLPVYTFTDIDDKSTKLWLCIHYLCTYFTVNLIFVQYPIRLRPTRIFYIEKKCIYTKAKITNSSEVERNSTRKSLRAVTNTPDQKERSLNLWFCIGLLFFSFCSAAAKISLKIVYKLSVKWRFSTRYKTLCEREKQHPSSSKDEKRASYLFYALAFRNYFEYLNIKLEASGGEFRV